MSESTTLSIAAQTVCEAIRRHAVTCEERPDDVAAVVHAGETLTDAVLNYESVLLAEAGWSNPIRHLGPLQHFDQEVATLPAAGEESGKGVEIVARYHLNLADEEELMALVRGRFAGNMSDVREAMEILFKADSWDPHRYSPRLISLKSAQVGVRITES